MKLKFSCAVYRVAVASEFWTGVSLTIEEEKGAFSYIYSWFFFFHL